MRPFYNDLRLTLMGARKHDDNKTKGGELPNFGPGESVK